ncbi:DNA-binding CsgD family transcriptional regulator [Sphingomonas trueperi]|uniref:helix-turn-helix domain-containing protein n=1 Tax=Sphingomonas trueperi TaxID=53317 RepID=UPI00339A0F13
MGDTSPQPRDDNALTEREKTTLRLLLAGHDAKSIARELGLSVHTVNERLRDARRKLGAASSREAARRLAESEAADPQKLGDAPLGVSATAGSMASPDLPAAWPQRLHRLAWLSGGMLIMSLFIAAVAAIALHAPSAPVAQPPAAAAAAENAPASLGAAEAWVALVDQGKWHDSWQTAAAMFRAQVSDARWAEMVTPVRQPLGAVVTRKFESVIKTKTLPGAPDGDYEVLKFQTNFQQRADSVETIMLVRESGGWRVAGYFIR